MQVFFHSPVSLFLHRSRYSPSNDEGGTTVAAYRSFSASPTGIMGYFISLNVYYFIVLFSLVFKSLIAAC
jgi:hypothetical protein